MMVVGSLGAAPMSEDGEGGDADADETAGGFGGTGAWLASRID